VRVAQGQKDVLIDAHGWMARACTTAKEDLAPLWPRMVTALGWPDAPQVPLAAADAAPGLLLQRATAIAADASGPAAARAWRALGTFWETCAQRAPPVTADVRGAVRAYGLSAADPAMAVCAYMAVQVRRSHACADPDGAENQQDDNNITDGIEAALTELLGVYRAVAPALSVAVPAEPLLPLPSAPASDAAAVRRPAMSRSVFYVLHAVVVDSRCGRARGLGVVVSGVCVARVAGAGGGAHVRAVAGSGTRSGGDGSRRGHERPGQCGRPGAAARCVGRGAAGTDSRQRLGARPARTGQRKA
jgi:hypothetical protein